MSTYQSFQSNTATVSNSVVIAKPVSLAVGDLMLASITGHRNSGSNLSLNTPAGWTLEEGTIGSANYNPHSVFSKIADSADVAAANFTFTSTGGSSPYIMGHLLRFTGFGLKSGETSNALDGSSTTLTATGFTPTRSNNTFVFFVANHSNVNVGTINTYAIATNNPTWTEQSEIGVNTANYDGQLAFATASRPESTATGTVTSTKSTADSAVGHTLILISLSPAVNGTITPTTQVNAYATSPVSHTQINAIVNQPTDAVSNPTQWANESTPTTEWTNEQI